MPNYDQMMESFPEKKGKYIKLKDGESYEGKFCYFNGAVLGQYGPQYPAQFSDFDDANNPMDRELTCSKAIVEAFQKANVQEGDYIRIERYLEPMLDQEQNPVMEQDGVTPRSMTRYRVTVLHKEGESAAAKPTSAASKAPTVKRPAAAAKPPTNDNGEINIDDIPF